MNTLKIHDQDFSLKTARKCEKAIAYIAAHLEKLEKQKTDIETALQNSMLDFDNSEEQRAELERCGKELSHFQALQQKLEKRRETLESEEFKTRAAKEIERVKKQSAGLAALCLKEIPAASRKLALLAALLQRNETEIYAAADVAEEAGIEETGLQFPMSHILKTNKANSAWYDKLKLPLLDEAMGAVNYWPLPSIGNSLRDNPDLLAQAEQILAADDMDKATKTVFRDLEKLKTVIREPEEEPVKEEERQELAWYEQPRSEWRKLLWPNAISDLMDNIGDKVEFWLALPEEKKLNTFIHFLSPEEREAAVQKLPEEERRIYRDHLTAQTPDQDAIAA